MTDLISRQAAIDAIGEIHPLDYNAQAIAERIKELPSAQPEIICCRDCKYFELDHFDNFNGISLITAHEICTRWGDGCKTDINGFCFLAEQEGE